MNETEVCERVLPPSMRGANLKKAREKGARGKGAPHALCFAGPVLAGSAITDLSVVRDSFSS